MINGKIVKSLNLVIIILSEFVNQQMQFIHLNYCELCFCYIKFKRRITKIKQRNKHKKWKKGKPKEIKSKAVCVCAHVDKRKERYSTKHISESEHFYPAKYIRTRVITTGASIQLSFLTAKRRLK